MQSLGEDRRGRSSSRVEAPGVALNVTLTPAFGRRRGVAAAGSVREQECSGDDDHDEDGGSQVQMPERVP